MLLGLLLLDILINNYTPYTSFFFILFLYNKTYKYYLITGLFLDLVIFNTHFYNLIILTIMYFSNKIMRELNKNNFGVFLFINAFNYLLFIILSNLLTFNNIPYILVSIGSNLVINLTFYILSFRLLKNNL